MFRPGRSFNSAALGLLLWGTALSGYTLTLGEPQGGVWLGQPLAFAVPLQLQEQGEPGSLCPQADIYAGDNRYAPDQVHVSVAATGDDTAALLKISADVTVDEPVVTVYVRVGCDQKIARRYVLMAADRNAASTTSAPDPQAELPVAPASRAAVPPSDHASAPGVPKAAAVPATARAASAPWAGKPHLTLEPVSVPAASSSAQLAAPHASAPARAPATALPTATAPAAESAQSRAEQLQSLQVQALQVELQGLLEQASANQLALEALRQQLERQQAQQAPLAIVYILLGLVLLGLLALLAVWLRDSYRISRQFRPAGADAAGSASPPDERVHTTRPAAQ